MNRNDAPLDSDQLPILAPPIGLEDRVIQELRKHGLLGARARAEGSRQGTPSLRKTLAAASAVGIALFATGVFAGQWLAAAGPVPGYPTSQEWPLNELAPHAALGFGLECWACTYDEVRESWRFEEQPQVDRIAPGTRAHEWGMISAARLVAVDGILITSDGGGERFSNIQPGDEVRWTLDRYGVERYVTTIALDRSEAATARRVSSTGDAASDSLRLIYSQRVGGIHLEVRVDPDVPGRSLVIEPGRTEEVVVRLGREEIRVRPVDER